MILVDTSVWVDHLRAPDAALHGLLEAAAVCTHPYVIGEIALGQLRQRALVLNTLKALPRAVRARRRLCRCMPACGGEPDAKRLAMDKR